MKKVLFFLCFGLSTQLLCQLDTDANYIQKDQQILDDLIVVGSSCVGQDCVNGESFGFDTQRYKENNLRIRFFDTSNSASFPTNDWQITINSSNNGGGNFFAIDDIDGGRTPFKVEAGAPTDALRIDNGGRVGLGVENPVVELHVANGDTPTLRLEQNGSSGFTPQTWDVAGNETNFFVRDATNGSKLIFKLRPGAPENSIFVDTNGEIGSGTASPTAKLDLRSLGNSDGTDAISVKNSDSDEIFELKDDGSLHLYNSAGHLTVQDEVLYGKTNKTYDPIDVFGALFGNNQSAGVSVHAIDESGNGRFSSRFGLKTSSTGVPRGLMEIITRNAGNAVTNSIEALSFLGNGNVGIGITTPSTTFEVNGIATKPGGGTWAAPSDKRLKKNIAKFEEGLETVIKLNPVTYNYNGKGSIKDVETEYVGLIAQEVQEVYSPMVKPHNRIDQEVAKDGTTSDTENEYLQIDPSAITYMLVNSVKELNSELKQKDDKINELESKLERIEALLENSGILDSGLGEIQNDVIETDLAFNSEYLSQNKPNPFKGETIITVDVPTSVSNAELKFLTSTGELIKSMNINSGNKSDVRLNTNELATGAYYYSLYFDGELIDTKKMIRNK